MAELLSLLENSEDQFMDFDEVAEILGYKEALIQVALLHQMELVGCFNPMWGIDLDEESFFEGSIIHLPGVLA